MGLAGRPNRASSSNGSRALRSSWRAPHSIGLVVTQILQAFNLQQAAERFYQCLFLVRSLYTPKTHNLNRLRALAEDMEPALQQVWPGSNREEKRAYAR